VIDTSTVAEIGDRDREGPVLVLESDDHAPSRARRFVTKVFAEWGISDDFVARLVASELVTNAYLHGEGAIIVRLLADERDGLPVIEVFDEGEGRPTVLPENHAATSGRGLPTVEDLAVAWGVRDVEGGGKVVWAKMRE
jgi:anti-sigma regulatory factor (Ser/Thr protein kinase)